MAGRRVEFRCIDCGAAAAKWVGRCPACSAWGTLVEEVAAPGFPAGPGAASAPEPLDVAEPVAWWPRSTGLDELDRVLGGGLAPGSVTLLGGEPGVGKSTLLLQLVAGWSGPGRRLYVTGEESAQQVRHRAARLGLVRPGVLVLAEAGLDRVVEAVAVAEPELAVVDSVHALADPTLGGVPGSVAQVRHVADRFVRLAKDTGVAVVLVGHVTKDGSLAGPRVLEHLVDTVLDFGGDRCHDLRLLRALKHRFGPTGELGVLEMTDDGLRTLADPSATLLADRRAEVAGSVVAPVVEGQRPLLVEVQALVAARGADGGRRTAQGLPAGRLPVVLAVLEQRAGLSVGGADVFAVVAGGVSAREPALDLPVGLAVASAATGVPVPADLVAIGELGLSGEVRRVVGLERRLAEAARLGFRRAVVPASAPQVTAGLVVDRVASVADALAVIGIGVPGGRRAA